MLPVLQTPFTAEDRLDLTAAAEEIRWAVGHGADGITIGMVSEVLRLSDLERNELTEAVVECLGPLPAVASCGGESTARAVEAAVNAESRGAAALMAIPPLHVAVGEDAHVEYFSAILDATTVPLVVQDASGYVGRPMSTSVIVRLSDGFGPRVMAKPEAEPLGPNLSRMRDAVRGKVPLFEGSGGIALVDNFHRGIAGTMPSVDLVWAIRAAWDALVAGDDEVAYDVIGALSGIVIMQSGLDAYVAIEKYLLVKQGVLPDGRQRGPVNYSIDRESREEIDRLFDRLDRVVSRSGYDPRASEVPATGRTA
ncbi:dihydrodipicolinate synthase family protein [Amnibacterium sp. CER49]|uniref:dihydrodipicolinate synthase family protein n=1 Tax=Amnibacterium sp. CER49 TaxID=3039161 RepID=UPI0024490B33|nr:dihydrodipicolinate synthase family protein [Amnibacterium sp. CER49]MDH2442848.1 dihydrodipicolinate synthase family protein [Amnibacterium sp. CER49]